MANSSDPRVLRQMARTRARRAARAAVEQLEVANNAGFYLVVKDMPNGQGPSVKVAQFAYFQDLDLTHPDYEPA